MIFFRTDQSDIKRRELGVVFENLRVVGLGAAESFQPTLGSTLNPFRIVDIIRKFRNPPVRDILVGFEGVVRPGEMLREFLPFTFAIRNLFAKNIVRNYSCIGPSWRWVLHAAEDARESAQRVSCDRGQCSVRRAYP